MIVCTTDQTSNFWMRQLFYMAVHLGYISLLPISRFNVAVACKFDIYWKAFRWCWKSFIASVEVI